MSAVLLGLGAGLCFGFIITRVGATDPDRMARGHLMIDPAIPQFMLLAVLLSALGLTGLLAAGSATITVLPTSLVATSVAAIIFGIGWGLAGYCPGTTWAAVGEGRLDAVMALLGGLTGTAVFAEVHALVIPAVYEPTNVGSITLMDAIGGPRLVSTGLLSVALLVGIILIRRFWGGGDAT
ncbi:MAG: YeeE/YedE thiosulfate transporter family protein [Planctomycetota bacterium]